MLQARSILARGVVQGVGFRPFVHRLATQLSLRGWVLNDADGVSIHAEGEAQALDQFLHALQSRPPVAAVITELVIQPAAPAHHPDFQIRVSHQDHAPVVRISPDLCVCDQCLAEMRSPRDRRHGYPYINCTDCGPRYSIVQSLPYDRANTTMQNWAMCPRCAAEFADPADRRFHAQPVACPDCGPAFTLLGRDGVDVIAGGPEAIDRAAAMLRNGAILAVKGLGGYHLACDASNAQTVGELRNRKFRKHKPFAVLVATIEQAHSLCDLSPVHGAALISPARPIVLAPARVELPGVAPGISELGIMLPSTPLHHLLIDRAAPMPLVLTSANRSSEPICYRDDDALDRLSGLVDAWLVGQRAIARRVDDSVVTVRSGSLQVIRRGRGMAPSVVARLPDAPPILAVGSDLKNAVALVVNGQVILSQHVGDLGDAQTDHAFDQTIGDLLAMYRVDPSQLVVAHDLHPQFVSTSRAPQLSAARCVGIQHHHAHAAAALAEHGLLEHSAVVLALDGTGWAPSSTNPHASGEIWGGEILLGGVRAGFTRVGHLRTAPLPGGDAAARHPVQAAAGRLHGLPELDALRKPPFQLPIRFVQSLAMIDADVRCFPSSSVGRLFDAAAALLGFLDPVSFEGQAAIWLEHLARSSTRTSHWRTAHAADGIHSTGDAGKPDHLDDRPWLASLIRERAAGVPIPDIARAFHLTLAHAFASAAAAHASAAAITTVVLTGGVLQNALLDQMLTTRLTTLGLRPLRHAQVPCNDGGIAVGQAALAWAQVTSGRPSASHPTR